MPSRFVLKLSGFTTLSGKDITALTRATRRERTVTAKHDLIREGDPSERTAANPWISYAGRLMRPSHRLAGGDGS
jgi:hypothetical protein